MKNYNFYEKSLFLEKMLRNRMRILIQNPISKPKIITKIIFCVVSSNLILRHLGEYMPPSTLVSVQTFLAIFFYHRSQKVSLVNN